MKTVTFGSLKFVPRRPGSASDPRPYWQVRAVNAEGERVTVYSGRAAEEDLPAIAAKLARAKVEAAGADKAVARRALVKARIEGATADDIKYGPLSILLSAWLATRQAKADLAKATVSGDARCVRALVEAAGDVPVQDFGVVQIEDLKDKLRERYAVSTVKLILSKLATAWGWAFKRLLVPSRLDLRDATRALSQVQKLNPSAAGERPKPTPSTARAWALADWIGANKDPRLARAYRLLLATGGRIGEVASARWEAVDWEARTVRLVGKTGPRLVPLDDATLAYLREGFTDDTPLADPICGYAYNTLRCKLPQAQREGCAALKIDSYTPHGLRRHAVDRYIEEGVSPAVAAKLLGHSPAVMLKAYSTVRDSQKRSAVEAVGLGVRPQEAEGNVIPFRRTRG